MVLLQLMTINGTMLPEFMMEQIWIYMLMGVKMHLIILVRLI